MGLFDSIRARLSLTTHDSKTIWKLFGSFGANQLGQNTQQQLQDGYEGNVDVFSIVKRIVDTSKVIPFVLERKEGEDWVTVTGNNSLTDLMDNPNPEKGLTWIDFIEQLAIYYNATGNGMALGLRPEGFRTIERLDVLPSGLTEVTNSNSNWFMPEPNYQLQINGSNYNFGKEEVGHVKMFNPAYGDTSEMLWGLSPIQIASRPVVSGNETWDARSNIYKNRGAIGMITSGDNQYTMTPDEHTALQDAFQKRIGGAHNFNKPIISSGKLQYVQLAMSPSDLKLIESGEVSLRAICNVYGLDPKLFGDTASSTFNNNKSALKQLYTNAVIPQNDKIASMLTNWLVLNHFPQGGYRLRPDYSSVEVLQEDFNEKAQTISLLKQNNIITANEARQHINLEESDEPSARQLNPSTPE